MIAMNRRTKIFISKAADMRLPIHYSRRRRYPGRGPHVWTPLRVYQCSADQLQMPIL